MSSASSPTTALVANASTNRTANVFIMLPHMCAYTKMGETWLLGLKEGRRRGKERDKSDPHS